MLKRIGRKVAVVWIAAAMWVSPMGAGAVTYEDSFDQCSYPKGFDLMVMRPLSLITIGVGGVLVVPFVPLALITVPRDIDSVLDGFIGAPVRFTFKRELGECTGVDLNY